MVHFNEPTLKFQPRLMRWILGAAIALLAACETPPQKPPAAPAPAPASPTATTPSLPRTATTAPTAPPSVRPPTTPVLPANSAALRQAAWADLPEWRDSDPARAWGAFLASCGALLNHDAWRNVCTLAKQSGNPDRERARRFFESHFTPYQIANPDGTSEGLITGYYEPLLHGSRRASERYRYPLYAVPDDLLVIDLAEVYPELKGMRLRGRLEGRRVLPYYDRAEIESGKAGVRGREIAWVDDPIELFFLQIQGSGRIELEDGQILRVGYAEQNGRPYRSIGRWLVERGELPLEKASMQGIKTWTRQNQERLVELLNQNARYVFFRELPGNLTGPLGALGVPLTAERSVAVDPRFVPLGAPVYVATTWPNSTKPLNRLMLAQDTGSAIQGAVRADFFWGFGERAAREAGRMKQSVRMWTLLPKGYPTTAK